MALLCIQDAMDALPRKRLSNRVRHNRYLLRLGFYPWIALPRPLREPATIAAVWGLQRVKRLRGIHRRTTPTDPADLLTLSFWGVPRVDIATMLGIRLADLLRRAGVRPEATTAIFHCADGYRTTHPLDDLAASDAFMAYAINGVGDADHGYPLRLVAEGKYGYKWAKWVTRIELTTGSSQGYWESRGLPDHAFVGDVR